MPGRSTVIVVLTCAAVAGIAAGVGSAGTEPSAAAIVDVAHDVAHEAAVSTGVRRARDPRPGDRWGGCNDARAAGTAPIYRGEPGYRDDMDGDGDGIACEPPRS